MQPIVLRGLAWTLTTCLLLACDGERKPEPTTPTDATLEAAGGQADASAKQQADAKVDAEGKANRYAKAVADTKAVVDAKREADAKTAADDDEHEPDADDEPSTPIPPRAVVFYRDAPKERVRVWALPEATALDPDAARDLGIVADDAGGSIHHGTGAPVLSGDGQWLAYLDHGRLELARVDGTAKHRITKHRGHQVTVLVSGFSPDSSALVFHQGEVQSEEGTPLPKGVVEGFQWLTVADRKLEPKPGLVAFRTFSEDGRYVVYEHPDRSHALMRYELATGAQEELQTIPESFGFSQFVVHGDHLVYVLHPGQGRSQVVADVLRGGKRRTLSPEGGFAQYQWPHVSPDGRYVTYTDETSLLVVPIEGGEARMVARCADRHCEHAWDGEDTLIVLDGGELSRVGLEGTRTPLATDVRGFAIGGAAG